MVIGAFKHVEPLEPIGPMVIGAFKHIEPIGSTMYKAMHQYLLDIS
jgi:hypothetical protein